MPEPVSTAIVAGLASAVNTAVTFVRFAYEIKNTPTDVKTCLDLVCRVDEDIQFAITLRTQHFKQLSANPETLKRLDRIIAQASESIIDIGRLLEGCRREAHGGKVPFEGRVKWIFGDSMAFSRRTPNLQQQHAAIHAEIAYMRQMAALKPLRDLTASTVFENSELLSMGRKRSSSRLSQSSWGTDAQPPVYSPLSPNSSYFSQALDKDSLNPEKRPGSASSTSTQQFDNMTTNPWSQPTSGSEMNYRAEHPNTWNRFEAAEPNATQTGQNWNPSSTIPQSWAVPEDIPRDPWNPFGIYSAPPTSPRGSNPFIPSLEVTNVQEPRISARNDGGTFEYKASSVVNTPILTNNHTSSTASSVFNSPQSTTFSASSASWNLPLNPIPSPPAIPRKELVPDHSIREQRQISDPVEDEDPEVSFYRELRRQEEEKRRRRAARMSTK